MQLHKNLQLVKLQPQICIAILIANEIWTKQNLELQVEQIETCVKPSDNTCYNGRSIDFPTRCLLSEETDDLTRQLAKALPEDFDVYNKGTWIHIEFNPLPF